MIADVEIDLSGGGRSSVKVNGEEVAACALGVESRVGELTRVTIELPAEVHASLSGAVVNTRQSCCALPPLSSSQCRPQMPDWTCAACGRVWRDWLAGHVRFWAEVCGPTARPA